MENLDDPELQWENCMTIATRNAENEYNELPVETIIENANTISSLIFNDLALEDSLEVEDFIVRLATLGVFERLLGEKYYTPSEGKYFVAANVKESFLRVFICKCLINTFIEINDLKGFENYNENYNLIENFRSAVLFTRDHPDIFGENTATIMSILFVKVSQKLKSGDDLDTINGIFLSDTSSTSS